MLSNQTLDDKEFAGVVEILAKRIARRIGQGQLSEAFWIKLCNFFRDRVVVRGQWRLPEALQWADSQVDAYMQRKRKTGY